MTSIEIAKVVLTPPEYARYKKHYTKSRRAFKKYNFFSAFNPYYSFEGYNYWYKLAESHREKIRELRGL